MASTRPTINEIKQLPIPDYLSKLGFEPAYKRGIDYWYHSPLHLDRTPSFKVNTKQNIWYDHGIGEGGTLIDLGIKLHKCTIHEFMNMVSQDQKLLIHSPNVSNSELKPQRSKVEILSLSALSSPDLIAYLNKRSIDKTSANQYCQQVEFRIGKRKYTAIGFPNRSGGYELRNNWFKGASSPKDVSVIENGKSDLCLIEGFIDFLSLLKIDQEKRNVIPRHASFVILNSLSMLVRSLDYLKEFGNIHLFLDNDLPAKNAKEILAQANLICYDRSSLYANSKDINDHLVDNLKTDVQKKSMTRRSSKF